MRIAWLSQFVPYPPTSGALERSYHLLRHAARHHEVHLLALEQLRLSEGGPHAAESAAVLRQFCASVEFCPMPFEQSAARRGLAAALSLASPLTFDRIWLHSPEMHRRAAGLAARLPMTLVHADTIGLLPYAQHFSGAPVALNHHNLESGMTARRAELEPVGWRAFLLRREARKQAAIERKHCPRVAMNLVVSRLDGDRLLQAAPESRVAVVENGVDTEFFTPGPDPGPEGGLVFVGTLGWYANRDAAAFLVNELLPALHAAGSRRRMALVGRDPRRSDWTGPAGYVDAPGYVADVRPYLRQACIYVCPIHDGGGTRLKVLVALAMAKPLVATGLAVEGLRLVPEEHFLQAESVGEFVAQIRRLESDPALRRRLGVAGRALVERDYDWTAIGGQLEAAYREATGTGND